MLTTLIVLTALAANPVPDQVLDEINVVRLQHSLPPVTADFSLEAAATIEAEWLGFANRRNQSFVFHQVDTSWLRKNYPKLQWSRLEATFPSGVPPSLSAFDVARLCGWNGGLVLDLVGEIRHSNITDTVGGWAGSPRHSLVLLDVIADFQLAGIGAEPRSGGRHVVAALFGVP